MLSNERTDELIARAGRGSRDALERLTPWIDGQVRRLVRAAMRSASWTEDDRRDAAQETWARLLPGLVRLRVRSGPGLLAFLRGIVRHTTYRVMSKRWTTAADLAVHDGTASPLREASARDELARAAGRLTALPPREAFAIRALVIDGRSRREAARQLGVSPGALSMAKLRGLARLRRRASRGTMDAASRTRARAGASGTEGRGA